MAQYKCKYCGVLNEIIPGDKVQTCGGCGAPVVNEYDYVENPPDNYSDGGKIENRSSAIEGYSTAWGGFIPGLFNDVSPCDEQHDCGGDCDECYNGESVDEQDVELTDEEKLLFIKDDDGTPLWVDLLIKAIIIGAGLGLGLYLRSLNL